jgi:hypothetical protein
MFRPYTYGLRWHTFSWHYTFNVVYNVITLNLTYGRHLAYHGHNTELWKEKSSSRVYFSMDSTHLSAEIFNIGPQSKFSSN